MHAGFLTHKINYANQIDLADEVRGKKEGGGGGGGGDIQT